MCMYRSIHTHTHKSHEKSVVFEHYLFSVCGYMCICECMHVRPEEGVGCTGTGLTDSYGLPHGFWESEPGLLEEQPCLLTDETSLQSNPPWFLRQALSLAFPSC